jgi:undecaprenyl-diphosphatase
LLTVATISAVIAVLPQIGSIDAAWGSVQGAESGWLIGALVLSLVTNLGFAIALMGTVPIRLALWPTTKVQVAMSFSNLAVPGIGGAAVQVRFLQKQGISLAGAVASGGLLAPVATVVAQCLLFPVALLLSPTGVDLGVVPSDALADVMLVVGLVAVALTGIVLRVPRLRRVVVPVVRDALSTIGCALRSPRRIALLLVGNVLVSILYAACLLLCIKAYGGDVDFWSLLAVNIGIGTIAPLIPVPGGGTALSVVGLSGALAAFGVADGVAVAAILTNQLVTNYLPAVVGWFATRDLLKQGLV